MTDEGYTGPAVVVGGAPQHETEVEVRLRGHFQPIDGAFHWYGRIQPSHPLDERHRPGDEVTLRTPHGQASARISDVDTWGRFRVAGTGRPPFPVT